MKLLKTLSLSVLVFVSFSQSALAQNDTLSTTKKKYFKEFYIDGKIVIQGVGNALTQPLRWQKDDFLTASAILAGTGLLYIADNDVRSFFLNHEDEVPKELKDFGFYFGKPQNFFILTGSIYGIGLLTANENFRHTGVLIITSAAASGIYQSLTKTVVGRARPSNGKHNDFKPFENTAAFHSFPSGHAILSFSMAHAIAKQFENIWVKAGIYTLGSISPISRLWADAHWVSDVGLGVVFSIVIVDGVDNFLKRNELRGYSKPKQISWQFKAGYGTFGVVGTF